MKHYFKGGRGLSFGEGRVRLLADERVNMFASYQDHSSRPILQNYDFRLLCLSKLGTSFPAFRSDGIECNDEDKRSLGEKKEGNKVRSSGFLRSFFGRHLTAALLWPYCRLTAALPLVRLRYDFSKAEVRKWWEAAHTWVILRQCTKRASASGAGWFGMASGLGRTCVHTYSTVVRVLFECCSSATRSPLEAESNSTRRCPEEVSNTSRSAVEGESNSFRRSVEAEDARTKVELALTQPITSVELGMNYQTTKDELRLNLERTRNELRIKRSYSRDTTLVRQLLCSPLNLHNTYINPTLYLHNRWIISSCLTQERTAGRERACFGAVPFRYPEYAPRNDGNRRRSDESGMVERMVYSDLDGFKKRCGGERGKDVSLCVKTKSRHLKGLNEVIRHCDRNEMERSNLKGLMVDNLLSRLLRQIRSDGRAGVSACLMILCVLFGSLGLSGIGAIAQTPQSRGILVDADRVLTGVVKSHTTHIPLEAVMISDLRSGVSVFTDRWGEFEIPLIGSDGEMVVSLQGYDTDTATYRAYSFEKGKSTIFLHRDISGTPPLLLGDTIPLEFWRSVYPVIQHPDDRTAITLSEFRKYPLIALDFWSVYCGPCIRSIDYLDSLRRQTNGNLAVIPVYVGNSEKAEGMMKNRGWDCLSIVGEKTNELNAYFFNKEQLGGLIIIKDGVFFAAPDHRELTVTTINSLVNGEANYLALKKASAGLLHKDRNGGSR